MARLLIFFLCLCSLVWGQPLVYQKQFELQICPDPQQLAPAIKGDADTTMELVRQLYELAGPKIGSRFVEPCYLLCLGDLRPYGAWNGTMVDVQPSDEAIIDRLNQFLVPQGYSLHLQPPRPDGSVQAFSIHSLEGLDKRTRESQLAWVPRYHRETGWAGYYEWKKEIYKRLPEGEYTFDRVEGVMLGYPDAAVDHQEEMVWSNWPTTVDCYLPLASYYDCGIPVFSLRWQDSNDSGVVALEQEWQGFLSQAYASMAHRELAHQQEFDQARRRKLSVGVDSLGLPLQDARYQECRRLGFTWRCHDNEALDSQLERWLPAHSQELAEALAQSADLQEAAQLTGLTRLRSNHLWAWILRGSCLLEGDAGDLFRSYRSHHPEALFELYRRQLSNTAKAIASRGKREKGHGWDGEPLAQMLNSDYCRSVFHQLPSGEQLALFEAVGLRAQHKPLGEIVRQARQGQGAYASAFLRLRRSRPQLWEP